MWRRYWEGYQGYRLEDVKDQIRAGGGQLQLVTEIAETIWENREDVHFRRFSGNTYVVPLLEKRPTALIFRVDWPNQ